MKRLFVLPAARGKGLGAGLVRTLIAHMAVWGYPTVRLDTATYLTDAIALYRRLGFVETEPYREIPPGSLKVAMFMELRSRGVGSTLPSDPSQR